MIWKSSKYVLNVAKFQWYVTLSYFCLVTSGSWTRVIAVVTEQPTLYATLAQISDSYVANLRTELYNLNNSMEFQKVGILLWRHIILSNVEK